MVKIKTHLSYDASYFGNLGVENIPKELKNS